MNGSVANWSKDFSNIPFGPLGIIAMRGFEEMGEKINNLLLKWRNEETQDQQYLPFPGHDRDTFLI